MIKNFFISTIRAFRRQKIYTSINISGLSVGIAVSLMLFLFIRHELSYDQFHEKGDRIFRVISRYTGSNGNTNQNAITFGSVAPEINKQIPEVEHATRIYNGRSRDIVYNQTTYQRHKFYYADHEFFSIFSFNSLYGNHPNKPDFDNGGVVISETLANTIFGNKVPLGQLLNIDGKDYSIVDVVNVPVKSHLQFDVLLSIENIEDLYDWSYHSGLDFHSYGLYRENTNHEAVNEKISELYNTQMNDRFANFITDSDNFVQPMSDIYLRSEGINSNLGEGSLKTIYILGGINLLILLIAVINYVNLTTAQYEKRIREIGVRKVIGANRKQLVFQFLGESVLLTLISFAGALGLTQLVFDAFGNLMQITAKIDYWSDPAILMTLLASALVLGIISGLYPALYISSFSSTKILKRDFPGMRKGTKGGKILVAIQFLIAIVLVMVYCLPAVFYLNPVNAKYEAVQDEFTSLHPILRLGVSTLIFLDKDLLITDANRKPEDYQKMGLKTKKHSLHYIQSNGYSHAIDLRTNGRSEIRNWLVSKYFNLMGFNTLRHIGTADHLHISIFSHDRPKAI